MHCIGINPSKKSVERVEGWVQMLHRNAMKIIAQFLAKQYLTSAQVKGENFGCFALQTCGTRTN